MKKYRVDTIKILHGGRDREDFEVFLNKIAGEGWEVHSVTQAAVGFLVVVSFKKK